MASLVDLVHQNVIVSSSSLHGNGVYVKNVVNKDEQLFCEVPLHFLQSLPNRSHTLVCGSCSKFLGSVGLQIGYLQGHLTRNDIMLGVVGDSPQYEFLSDIVPCGSCCGELYCSEICQNAHFVCGGHKYLCTGNIGDEEAMDHPLIKFKIFAVETNEIFLMIADIIARALSFAEEVDGSVDFQKLSTYMSKYETFVRNIWWEAIKTPKKQVPSKFRKTLQKLVKDTSSHLDSVFNLTAKGLSTIFGEEWIARTIGMFEQNNVGVRVQNPIAAFVRRMAPNDPSLMSLYQDVLKIQETIDGDRCEDDECDEVMMEEETENELMGVESGESDDDDVFSNLKSIIEQDGEDNVFPPLDGTAFYLLTCRINHSCEPNAKVNYTCTKEEGLKLQMNALRDIQRGEEILQSYIDQNMTTIERQEALADYGFKCTCNKCLNNQ